MERPYTSPLRQQQQEMTRNRIMEALIGLINEGRIHDFTIRDVAERAGVSYGSVYRHYTTREELLRALVDWAHGQSKLPVVPGSLVVIPEWTKGLMAQLEEQGETVAAIVGALTALNIHPEGTQRRDRHVQGLVEGALPTMTEAETRKVAAVLRHLSNSAAWRAMRKTYGLGADETGEALSWALSVLIDSLVAPKKREEEG